MDFLQEILVGVCVAGATSFAIYQVYSRLRGSGDCGKGCSGCKDKKVGIRERPLVQINIVPKKNSSLPSQ